MKYFKKSVAFAAIAVLGLGLFSCQKCTTCDIVGETGTIILPGNEICGDKAYVDEYKAASEAAAAQYENATARCTE